MTIRRVIMIRDWRRLRLPAALLLGLLQRWPILRSPLSLSADFLGAGATVVAAVRLLGLAGTSVGPLHAQTGATQFVTSQPEPIQGVVGEPLTVAFSITATPTAPNRFFINSPLPPGLSTVPAMNGNRVSSGTPVITGTPIEAGIFAVNVTGSDGFHALSRTITFEIAERRRSSVTAAPANTSTGRVAQFSILTELRADTPELAVRVTPARDGETALLARAVGPSLAAFGLEGLLADPRLELISDSGVVSMNDDWNGDPALAAAMAAAGAFPLSDPRSADAALISAGFSGGQTWRVTSATSGFGTLLFEATPISAAGGADSPGLMNGSFRHRLDSARAMVLGFVVRGAGAVTLTLRVGAASAGTEGTAIAAFDSTGGPIAMQPTVDELGTRILVLPLPPGADTVVLRAETSVEILVDWSVE